MTPLFYKSLTTAVIITIVFLAVSSFEVYLEETHAITGHRKNLLKAPVQFLLIFIVSLTVLHFFSHWFHVKQWIWVHVNFIVLCQLIIMQKSFDCIKLLL